MAVVPAAFAASAGKNNVCKAIDATPRDLPYPAACLQHAGIKAPASDPEASSKALFAYAKERVAAGQFDEANRSLDCADAVLGDTGNQLSRYELIRQRGILDYHQERIPEALQRFECALDMSRVREDRVAMAKDLKNVGTALRRLGDLRGALRTLTSSLEMQRANGSDSLGPVYSNIADVYRALGESQTAFTYYHQAQNEFIRTGDPVEAAHLLETMSVLALDNGDATQAGQWLEQALATYQQIGNHAYQLRVYAGLIRAAVSRGALAQAQRWSASAQAMASEHQLPLPAQLQVQIARVDRLSGRPQAAIARLQTAIAALSERDADRAALLEEWSRALETMGDTSGAISLLRRAHAAQEALAKSQQDQQLGWLRSRFEATERERTIAALEAENRERSAMLRQRTLLLWLTVASVLIFTLIVSLLMLRHRQRARIADAIREAKHQEELTRYRRETEALAEDRTLLQTLLDARDDAVCLLDDDGQMLAANRSARRLLGPVASESERSDDDHRALAGHLFFDYLDYAARDRFTSVLERMEDSAAQTFEFVCRGSTRSLSAQLAQWSRGDGLIVLNLHEAVTSNVTTPVATPIAIQDAQPTAADTTSTEVSLSTDTQLRDEFRRALVELMLSAVEHWERSTGQSRLELAEKSRIWRVAADDGRVRARAMERYLALSKLPQNPRWRDVLRSAYYVLGHCQIDTVRREQLQRQVDAVLAYTRRSALV